MNVIPLRCAVRRRTFRSTLGLSFAVAMAAACPFIGVAAESPAAPQPAKADADDSADSELVSLAAYNVKADRIEDFGIRVLVSPYPNQLKPGVGVIFSKFAPMITAILPNTAAARAGLQPGERILKSEGQSTVGGGFSSGAFGQWHKTQKKKWAEVATGKKNVTWTLEVETPATKAVRTVRLVVPTPPPHWGASLWRMPEGRSPSSVPEPGPLAERSRAVLDNGIWSVGFIRDVVPPGISLNAEPTGYEWQIRSGSHRIFVTQFRGRTDVVLETNSRATGRWLYLTSPSGALERAWHWQRGKKSGEVSLEGARAGFEHELDLWTTKVEKISARWPFELKPGYDPDAIFAILAPKGAPPAVDVVRPLTQEFLNLPPAAEAERALFTDAYAKLGADSEYWAYTETSRGLEDKRVTVTRVDPSKPEAERSVLLSIDGKTPTPADWQRWRDDGGDIPKTLGDIPPLANLVDFKDLRVIRNETAAIVFELPMRGGSADFPAENFQALFRINKTHRAFEDITVKLRENFRVAGVVKVVEAGLHVRFQTLDPAHPPQPVLLKGGGAARIVLVKFARDFETTRADFKRVNPFDETAGPAK